MTVRSNKVLLEDILEAIELIERRMHGKTAEQFLDDVDLQDMVVRRLEIIGEAMRIIPREFREEHFKSGWKGPVDMRSKLIHDYFDVDPEIVWDVVMDHLPTLKSTVRELLARPDIE
jgi:uncharacterized protein with HEPN domain